MKDLALSLMTTQSPGLLTELGFHFKVRVELTGWAQVSRHWSQSRSSHPSWRKHSSSVATVSHMTFLSLRFSSRKRGEGTRLMESRRWGQSMKQTAHTSSARDRGFHQNFPRSLFAACWACWDWELMRTKQKH